jgi:hypothetical protein
MIMTVTNLSSTDALEVGFPINRTIAASGNVALGVSMADLLFGEDQGDPAYKRLDELVRKGLATVAVAADPNDANVLDEANEL